MQQLSTDKNVKLAKQGGDYAIHVACDTGRRHRLPPGSHHQCAELSAEKVVLFDKDDTAIVTLEFTSFKTGVKYSNTDFDPHKIATSSTKATMANVSDNFAWVAPDETLGDSLDVERQDSATSALLRYTGDHTFTLAESIPGTGVAGVPAGELVDLYGVPALYYGSNDSHQLTWLNNGYEFSLSSGKLSLEQMKAVAISTFGQVGK